MPSTKDDPSEPWISNSPSDHIDPDGLIDTAIVARYLDTTPRTIDNYRKRKLIPYIKIGGAIRFRLSDVKRAIRDRYTVEVAR